MLTVQVIMTIGGPGPRGGDDVNVSSGRMGDGKGVVGAWGGLLGAVCRVLRGLG